MNHALPTPAVCQRCAAQGSTCCSMPIENLEFCFPLSRAEMATIQSEGKFGPECFVQVPNSRDFIAQLARLLPDFNVGHVFVDTGIHWRLMVTDQGDCIFLRETGCCLHYSMRPRYCRLFPLWVYQGCLTWFTMPECLAYREKTSLRAILEAMQTNSQEVQTLFEDMCLGLGLEQCRRDRQ